MTNTTPTACTSCGAPSTGTRFCENCGQEFVVPAVPTPVPPTKGFLSDGATQWKAVARGRSGRILAAATVGVLLLEALVSALLLSMQHTDATFHGYHYGANVGASVASSQGFNLPYIEEQVLGTSPDGKYVYAAAGSPNQLLAFDTASLKQVAATPLAHLPAQLLVASDGSIVVQSGDRTVEVFAEKNGQLTRTSRVQLATPGFVSEIATSPDASTVYAILSDQDQLVVAFDTRTGAAQTSISIDGSRVASLTAGGGTVYADTSNQLVAMDGRLDVVARDVLDTPNDDPRYYDGIVAVPDGSRVLYSDEAAIVALQSGALAKVGDYSPSYGVTGEDVVSLDGKTGIRQDEKQLFVFDAEKGDAGFSMPVDYGWPSPVILKDPSLGFIAFTQTGSGSEVTSGHLSRYLPDAPRVTPLGLASVLLPLDLGLFLALLSVVFLIPVFRRRHVVAANAEAVRLAQVARDADTAQALAAEASRRALAEQNLIQHQTRVQQLAEWEAAWTELHPGQPMPAMPSVPPLATSPAVGAVVDRTNTLAILALIFGLGGGLLGIIFGHVALSQIARTGERGRGLALAGLIFGYVGLGATIVFLIIVAAIAASHQ